MSIIFILEDNINNVALESTPSIALEGIFCRVRRMQFCISDPYKRLFDNSAVRWLLLGAFS